MTRTAHHMTIKTENLKKEKTNKNQISFFLNFEIENKKKKEEEIFKFRNVR